MSCAFLVTSTIEARTRVYLCEKLLDHHRLLLLRAASPMDLICSAYMPFFAFSSAILLYTSSQSAAHVSLLTVVLQTVTIALYYRSVYDLPSQLTPLVDVARQHSDACLTALAETVIVTEDDLVRDIVGICWFDDYTSQLLGNNAKIIKQYGGLLVSAHMICGGAGR